jgi:hypothetical protein
MHKILGSVAWADTDERLHNSVLWFIRRSTLRCGSATQGCRTGRYGIQEHGLHGAGDNSTVACKLFNLSYYGLLVKERRYCKA